MAERTEPQLTFGEMRRMANEVPLFDDDQDFRNQVVLNLREVFTHLDNTGVEITQDGNSMAYLAATFCSAACLTLFKTLAVQVRNSHTEANMQVHKDRLEEIDNILKSADDLLEQIKNELVKLRELVEKIIGPEYSSSRDENKNLYNFNYGLMKNNFVECNRLLSNAIILLDEGMAQVKGDKRSVVLRGASAVAGAVMPVVAVAKTMESLTAIIGMLGAIGAASAIGIGSMSLFGYLGSQIWKQFQSLSGFQEQYIKQYANYHILNAKLGYLEDQFGIIDQTKMLNDLQKENKTLKEEIKSFQQEAKDKDKEVENLKKQLAALTKQQNS